MRDLGQDLIAALRRDRAGGHTGRHDLGRVDAALHQIVGQFHQLDEAMVHDRQPSIGAEHAQPVRHVVQCGIELTSERRFALPRYDRLHEDSVQIGRELHQSHEKDRAHDRHGHVIRRAAQGQRDDGRTEDQRHLKLKGPLPAVSPARAARSEPGGDRQGDHVGHRVVSPQERCGAPDSDRSGLDRCPEL